MLGCTIFIYNYVKKAFFCESISRGNAFFTPEWGAVESVRVARDADGHPVREHMLAYFVLAAPAEGIPHPNNGTVEAVSSAHAVGNRFASGHMLARDVRTGRSWRLNWQRANALPVPARPALSYYT